MNQDQYKKIVADRKLCILCHDLGLSNPSMVKEGKFDSEEVGPWSQWQGKHDADLMVVGQHWGSEEAFVSQEGREDESSPTNLNLKELLDSIGFSIQSPGLSTEPHTMFFTNAILCLKEKSDDRLKSKWFKNCQYFLRSEIELIKPKVIVGLGQYAFENILKAFDLKPPKKFRDAVQDPDGTILPTGSRVFAVYLCAPIVINKHTRDFSVQKKDWKRIGATLNE